MVSNRRMLRFHSVFLDWLRLACASVNEVPDILNAALISPKELRFETAVEARSWVYRANNFITRHRPELRQLMITRRGPMVTIRVPRMEVRDA